MNNKQHHIIAKLYVVAQGLSALCFVLTTARGRKEENNNNNNNNNKNNIVLVLVLLV